MALPAFAEWSQAGLAKSSNGSKPFEPMRRPPSLTESCGSDSLENSPALKDVLGELGAAVLPLCLAGSSAPAIRAGSVQSWPAFSRPPGLPACVLARGSVKALGRATGAETRGLANIQL
jgi:hypothetical protein